MTKLIKWTIGKDGRDIGTLVNQEDVSNNDEVQRVVAKTSYRHGFFPRITKKDFSGINLRNLWYEAISTGNIIKAYDRMEALRDKYKLGDGEINLGRHVRMVAVETGCMRDPLEYSYP